MEKTLGAKTASAVNMLELIGRLNIKIRLLRARSRKRVEFDSEQLSEREMLEMELLSDHEATKNQPMSLSDLARGIMGVGVGQSTISADLKSLVKRNFIIKQLGTGDGRHHFVALTEEGKLMVQTIREQRAASFAPLARGIGNDPHEKMVLEKMLLRVIAEVEKELDKF